MKLKQFQKFDSAATALEEVVAIIEGKVTPKLSSLLETIKDEAKASLAVADPKLGKTATKNYLSFRQDTNCRPASAINKLPQLSLKPISDSTTSELYRTIREHLPSLIPGLMPTDVANMALGLSHSLSRHKLKFSPDKVDTMVVQAIALLDDLDKELNLYAMRVKEWYGWHFPEMAKIINDNLAYARVILAMGMRTSASNTDLAEILPEEIEIAVKAAAEVSMGTEITTEDLENIQNLAQQVVDFTGYRQQLSSYLSARMAAIAPNLTALVGDLVGARLIAHAGSLMSLAKQPASTIQILGAEKALFRALKTKHNTPKYGLIFHASLVGQATGRNKAKIARMLAAKAAIGLRVDALADWGIEGEDPANEPSEEKKAELGIETRIKIERKLASLEGRPIRVKGVAIGPNGMSNQPGKWEVKEARKYNKDADGLVGDEAPAAAGGLRKKKIQDITPAGLLGEQDDVKMSNGNEAGDGVDSEEEEDKMDTDGAEDLNGDGKHTVEDRMEEEIDDKHTNGDHKEEDESDSQSSSDRKVKIEKPVAASNGATDAGPPKKSKDQLKAEKKAARKAIKSEAKVKDDRYGGLNDLELDELAQRSGLDVKKFKKKIKKEEIRIDENGRVVPLSDKEIKRAKIIAAKGKTPEQRSEKKKREKEQAKMERKLEKQRAKEIARKEKKEGKEERKKRKRDSEGGETERKKRRAEA